MRRSARVLVCLSAAVLAGYAALPVATSPVLAQENGDSTDTILIKGMHEELTFDKDVSRIAVGDSRVLSAEVLTSQSILLLGLETGRTSLLVWYEDESLQRFVVSVQPDLDILRRALKDIHPNIQAEMAPDREAVILRGVVPDAQYSQAAEQAAATYLAAGRAGTARTLVRARDATEAPTGGAAENLRAEGDTGARAPVINLLRVESLPEPLETRLQRAISETGGSDVRVRRLTRGDQMDDERDVFVLEGFVPDQTTLTRLLFVAGTLVAGESGEAFADEVEVGADESGALYDQSGSGSTRGGSSGGGRSGGGSSSIGGSSGSSSSLGNDIDVNIGRAKVVSLGGGRILSFVEVRDLPQVRVDVRIFEVNRSKLLEYAPEFDVIASDFEQGGLLPPRRATSLQGFGASGVGGAGREDIQGVLSFLADGATADVQVAGNHYAVDAALQILESRGLARGLANPSLTVLSGENASFQVGGQIPVPESFAPSGVDTADGVFSSIEFRNFGIELAVRPLVGSDGKVTVDVFTQVDQPSAELTTLIRESTGADQSTTSFESRTLDTSARLDDGQSLVMAGLISRSDNNSTSYTPGLESIPVVGWLFKRFSIEEQDREIVVVINPTVVRDPIDGLAAWAFPDLSGQLRDYIDEVLEYNGVPIKRYEEGTDVEGAADD